MSVHQVPEGIAFGDETAYVLFGIAGKDNSHLSIISRIADVCSDEDKVDEIRWAGSKEDILRVLGLTSIDA